jgi:flagellar motor switch protein FliM
LPPHDGSAAVEFEPEIIFPMIERLLAGVGRPAQYTRALTEIESSIVQALFKLLVDNLRESWRPIYAIEFNAMNVEVHPHLVQVVAPNEMVIHFQFNIRMRETLAKMHLVLPMLVLEPIIHIFDQEFSTRKKIISDTGLLEMLQATKVQVSLETRDTLFPMNELLSLQVGDTLVLDQREEWPAQLKVAGVPKFTAQARKGSNSKSFEIASQHWKFKEDKNGTD